MKILQVIPAYYPAEAYGGTVRLAHDLSTYLAARGHEVVVYTSDTLNAFERQKQKTAVINGIKIYYFHNLSNRLAWHRMIFNPGIIPQISKEAASFDVFQLHGLRSFENIVAYQYAMKHQVPYILLTGGSVLPIGGKVLMKKVFDSCFGGRILRDAAGVIAANKIEIEEHRKMGVKDNRIVRILPSYDIKPYTVLPPRGQFRERYGIQEKPLIMFMGRINAIKGTDFLVRSFGRLSREVPDAVLAIVGPDDGYKPVLDNLVRELGITDRVLFPGFLGGEQKNSALVDADVMVQTSVFERGPGSPFEAVLCNTPIIVTRNTGAGELVGEVDAGYLVDYGEEEQLAGLMRRVLDDPSEARSKAQRAKRYIINSLCWDKIVIEYEDLYKSVLKVRKSR